MPKGTLVILGAGLTGLSAAFFLKKDGQIFEKEDIAGGLCRSRHIQGYTFDYDGHLLHFRDQATLTLVQGLMGDNLVPIQRNSWVNAFGRYAQYPFQANLSILPKNIINQCVQDFVDAQLNGNANKPQPANFRQWALRTFGRGIAKYFMFPYNQKFWTVAPQRLSCEWVDGFIPIPTIADVLKGAVAQKSRRRFGYNAQFWYPRQGGMEKLIFSLQSQIKQNLYTRHRATEIDLINRTVSFQNGRKVQFSHLISTLPLPEMLKLIPHLPAGVKADLTKLQYTSIFCLNLGVDRSNISDKHWIYFPEKEFIFFRVGFPTSFSSSVAPPNRTCLYVEVAYSKYKPLSASFSPKNQISGIEKRNLINRILKDLQKAGILHSQDVIEVCDPLDIKYAYIIYDRNYRESTNIIHQYLNSHNVYSIGRYGRWKYMSMEDAILEGKDIAQKISKRR